MSALAVEKAKLPVQESEHFSFVALMPHVVFGSRDREHTIVSALIPHVVADMVAAGTQGCGQ